jgi:hypothetical protein
MFKKWRKKIYKNWHTSNTSGCYNMELKLGLEPSSDSREAEEHKHTWQLTKLTVTNGVSASFYVLLISSDAVVKLIKAKEQSHNTPMEAQGLIHELGNRWGERTALRPSRALAPGKGPPVPIGQEAGWAPEPVWTQEVRRKILFAFSGETRSPGRPVRRQTLYWLSYSGS